MRRLRALLAGFMLLVTAARPSNAPISIDVHDADLADVLSLLAAQSGCNIVEDWSVKPQRITLHLRNVSFQTALNVIVRARDLQVREVDGTLIVGASDSMNRRYGTSVETNSARTVVMALEHGLPDDVAKELTPALPEGTVIVPDKRTGSIVITGSSDTVARAQLLAAALDAPRLSGNASNLAHVYALRFAKASSLAANLKGVLPDGSYVADDAQNAIVVTGNEEVQRSAAQFVASMDVASPQVLFEVRVADVMPELENSNVGLEFGGYDLAGQPLTGAATYAFTKSALSINARLNALISKGKAQILATPKLVTLNNKEADLLIGQTYPVVFYDARLGGQQVQFVDVGVKLRLTPTIGSDGSVTAEMHPEYSAIQTFVGGYPVIANRRIDSTLRVRDNETIVLGGLLRDIDQQTITKIPWLSDIPVFGKVFQNREHTKERDEVVFLITPHIVYPGSPLPAK